MDDATCKPAQNAPNNARVITDEEKKKYISDTLDKFIDKYIFDDNEDGDEDENEESSFSSDGVCCYSVNVHLLPLPTLKTQLQWEMGSI